MKSSKRFQISLRTFLVIVLLFGTALGIWIGIIQPVRSQWAAVAPILKLGGRVETSPSKIPNWMKSILPAGQTENVEAVFFNYQAATNESIEALERLPHLRRLYLQRAQLNSEHLKTIARLQHLERLSIWGNEKLNNNDLIPLANLENLQVLDIHQCRSADWKALLPFCENQKIRIVQSFARPGLGNANSTRLNDLKTVERFFSPFQRTSLDSSNVSDLKRSLERFPKVTNVWVSFEDEIESTYFTQLLEISRAEPLEIILYPNFSPHASRQSRVRRAISLAWEQLGPHCDSLKIETESQHPDVNQLIFRYTKDAKHVEVSFFISSEFKIPASFFEQLPMLPNIEIFTLLRHNDNLIPGMEQVLEKIPNVTKVSSYRAGKWQSKFWDWLSRLEKVEQLSIIHSTVAPEGIPSDFPGNSQLRKTLTELNIEMYVYDSELAHRFMNACPQLKSLKFNTREVERNDKGGLRVR